MKKSAKFPVVSTRTNNYPQKAICPVCRRRKVFEPHSFAVISGGAWLMNRRNDSVLSSDKLDGYLDLTWHGAHDDGKGDDREIYTVLYIAKEVRGGDFSLYFCSTKCLRTFLNSSVDALERSIKKAKQDFTRKRRKYVAP